MRNHSLLRPTLVSAALTVLFCSSPVDPAAAAEIPSYYKQLIAQGNVEFEFYDPRVERRRYPGQALFLLYVDHRYQFRFDTIDHDGEQYLKIRPGMQKVECRVDHTVRLPDQFDSDHRWNHWLVAHEFDHVAISSDPRPIKLVEHLLKRLRLIRRAVDPTHSIDVQFVDRIVNEEIVKRRDSVQRLIQSNYDLLDEVTGHGMRPIPNREAFFTSLYARANLEQMQFPYTTEVSSLLSDRTYRNAKLHYEFAADHNNGSPIAASMATAAQGWLRWLSEPASK
ncbi:MAG TPA: hypothetical protein VE890_03510 [Thermoguttaceae bacterium]|nr:hypothetical protein [Thermoguttaceae bacterium]